MSKKILILSPHTDDGELGCGGSISKFVEEKNDVYYAAFSCCEKSVPEEYPCDILRTEVKAATGILGTAEPMLYDFEVREFPRLRQEILDTLINIREKLLKPGGLLVIDVPNEFNDFQVTANAEYGLKEWWICPPNHINYFSVSSMKHLLEKCGYSIEYCESSFPIEIFMLMGDVYVGNSELGKACHQKRVKFEYLMKKHGKSKKLSEFYQALSDLDLGRQVVVYATPDKGAD